MLDRRPLRGNRESRRRGNAEVFDIFMGCMVGLAVVAGAKCAATYLENAVPRETIAAGTANAVRIGLAAACAVQGECPPVARWVPRPGMRFQAMSVYRRLAGRFAAMPDGDGVRCMTGPGVATSCNSDCRGIDLDRDGDVDMRDVAAMQLLATFIITGEG